MPRTLKRRLVTGPSTRHLYINDEPITGDAAAAIMGWCYWVNTWLRDYEEAGGDYACGSELTELAPPMPQEFLFFGHNALGRLEQAQREEYGGSWAVLLHQAAKADGVEELTNRQKREFFWYMAMQMMGTGCSWWDDHEKFACKVPYHTNDECDATPYLYGTPK